MDSPYTLYGISATLGLCSNLVLDKLLEKKFPSKARILTIGFANASLGVGSTLYLKNYNGFAYALGASIPTILRTLTYSPSLSRSTRPSSPSRIRFEDDQTLQAYDAHVQLALDRAHQEWERNVTERSQGGDWQRINEYIKGLDGLSRTSANDYVNDGDFAWCGAFVAFAWGPQVKLDIRKKMSACSNMYNAWRNTPRYIENKIPQPGDIVTVFPNDHDRSHAPGTHLMLAASAPDENGFFESYDGNSKGLGPNGHNIEGVVYRNRHISRIANVYRLLPEDFEDFYLV